MRSILYLAASLTLVAMITFVAAFWVHVSHTRVVEGRIWLHLWGTHGVHTFDLLVLAAELGLLAVLVLTLLAGFCGPRR